MKAIDQVIKGGKSKNKNIERFNIPASTFSNVLQNKNDMLQKYGNNKRTMEKMKISEHPALVYMVDLFNVENLNIPTWQVDF